MSELRIIAWTVIIQDMPAELHSAVNKHIALGWEPKDKLIVRGDGPFCYIQTMVKYE